MGAHLEDFPMSQLGWSADRVTALKSLWLDGLSASQIARQLGGVTRNAVVGKIHRLGLSGRSAASTPARLPRPPTSPAPRRETPPQAKALVRPAPFPSPTSPATEGPGLVASMTALGPHTCKWPIGDPKAASFTFCGRLANGAYCPAHKAQAIQPGTAWRVERDPMVRRVLAGLA
jgi:GcrA cell cycle regulator